MADFSDVEKLLFDVERDTLLYHAGFDQSLRALQAICESAQGMVAATARPSGDQVLMRDAHAMATLFLTIFSSQTIDLEAKLRRCSDLQATLDPDGPVSIVVLLTQGKLTTLYDTIEAEKLFQEALQRARKKNRVAWEVCTLLRLSRYQIYISHYQRALPLSYEALKLLESHHQLRSFYAMVEFHLGLCFSFLEDHRKALEHLELALQEYRKDEQHYFVAYTLQIKASVLHTLLDEAGAQLCYEESARTFNDLQEWEAAGHAYTNCGLSFLKEGKFDEAQQAMDKARGLFESSTDLATRAGNCLHRAMLYGNPRYEQRNASKALGLYREAFMLAEKTANRHLIASIYRSRSNFYRHNNDWQQALDDFEHVVLLEREIFRTTVDEKIRSIEQTYQRKMAEQEQLVTTLLLQKVLPEAVVERMKHDEHVADSFDNVTVFFADICNFTGLALELSPKDLIVLLNSVFGMFDVVMRDFGCEKIKTIGDGYMAVAGAPTPIEFHQERMLLAALQLQEHLSSYTVGQALNNLDHASAQLPLAFRMGIHCGSLVAGVVGTQRFIYDVYGDTVNTAARMESHGMENEVQLSAQVVSEICDHCGLNNALGDFNHSIEVQLQHPESAHLRFLPRGVIPIKGKGTMHTYFVQRVVSGT